MIFPLFKNESGFELYRRMTNAEAIISTGDFGEYPAIDVDGCELQVSIHTAFHEIVECENYKRLRRWLKKHYCPWDCMDREDQRCFIVEVIHAKRLIEPLEAIRQRVARRIEALIESMAD